VKTSTPAGRGVVRRSLGAGGGMDRVARPRMMAWTPVVLLPILTKLPPWTPHEH
jgi:hypothetical protein